MLPCLQSRLSPFRRHVCLCMPHFLDQPPDTPQVFLKADRLSPSVAGVGLRATVDSRGFDPGDRFTDVFRPDPSGEDDGDRGGLDEGDGQIPVADLPGDADIPGNGLDGRFRARIPGGCRS